MSHSNKPSRRSNPLHNSRGTAEKATFREIPPIQPTNVIARLMGIDAIPTSPPPPPPPPNPAAAAAAAAAIVQAHPASSLKPPTSTTTAEIKAISPRSAPFRQAKCSLLSYGNRNTGDASSRLCLNKMRVPERSRSRQRRHPQEDLLQKIKQDFQAWQTSKAMASATTVAAALGNNNNSKYLESRCIQMIAQENLRKEKMARYGFANCRAMDNNEQHSLKNVVQETDSESAANEVADDEPKPEERRVITVLRAISPCAAAPEKSTDFEAGKDGHDHRAWASDENPRPPTPIVLLKPSSNILPADGQEPLFGLPKVKRDGNMSRFLQEVKQMLQKQLDVNATVTSELNTIVTWGTGPKQIAPEVAKQITHTVTKDVGKRFFRSESFRAFRSDRKRNEATTKQASPEHVRIVTRNILPHRLKSVTSRSETVSPKKDDEESTSSCSVTSRERPVRSLADVSPSGIGFGEQSFRSECLTKHKDDGVSPARVLFRSFSAPESGFSLGRLFGDGSVSSTAHEASDILASEGAAAMTAKNNTSFSFVRGTVSSLRHRFSLGRNLFRRKAHWSKRTSLGLGELHPQVAIGTAPPSPETFNLFKANLTELPPSPVSPLEVVGHSCRHFFSDLNCTLPELSPKCLSEFEPPASELSYRTDITVETACNHDKAYIREVLVAAGLYDDGSLDNKANARVDSMARPICDNIFEEVEDIYYYRGKYCDDGIGMYNEAGGTATDHRMLFDLANEALQSLVQGAKTGSSLRQWVIDSTGVSRGRRLVDDVWQQMQTLRNPQMQEMQTIDSMVAYEIRKSVWAEVLYEDVYVVGRKIERAIFDELIEDLSIEVFI
ncbi:hypothetical protein BAE44_0003356 [Dichanthelium oligosanthes]|uniref:DUF4378 domain-containing protein n=1 Tax=Dichanthelium oligosanthes TaxID=888268 RepID=A0A1E5WDZ8_9POAL|nr:hypothetical protein BAE44_0003356 [Dichanthelium oligosanthes]